MKLVQPKFEEINIDNPLLHGEMCARVCYKSENLIKEGSAKKLLKGIADAGHTAMLEHISVYLKITAHADFFFENTDPLYYIINSPYTKYVTVFKDPETKYYEAYISTNLRVIHENSKKLYDEFMDHDGEKFVMKHDYSILHKDTMIENCKLSEYPDKFMRRVTIKFTMDRIGSQSFCRHRVFSFAQESTRWCNYLKDKFGSEISISTPCWLKSEDQQEFEDDMTMIEQLYFKWINKGYKAEEARYFLPFGLKTEIVMTGFMDAWIHFFDLRIDSHAHPQARELAIPLHEYFLEKEYISY